MNVAASKPHSGGRVVLVAGRAVDGELDVSSLEESGFIVDRDRELENNLDEQTVIARLRGSWGVVAGGEVYSRRVLEALPELRIVARMGVGYDRVDVAAATALGVLVSITPGTIEPAVAEWTVAHILVVRRRLFLADRAVREGRWTLPQILSPSLVGATVGLIGLGRIGREVVKRLAGFGCTLIGSDPLADPDEWRARHVEVVDLDTLLERSDVVSLHVPLSEGTRGLIGAKELARMRPSAILINTSRGGLVDEEALAAAIRNGRIAGAGLDAFASEPLPASSSLRDLDNVVLTGHVAYATHVAARAAAQNAIDAVAGLARGEMPMGVLNPEVIEKARLGYRATMSR
jgi:D-3-phosphoglycerate dehydrogenase/(S)-sulfolactate dehydrogenase